MSSSTLSHTSPVFAFTPAHKPRDNLSVNINPALKLLTGAAVVCSIKLSNKRRSTKRMTPYVVGKADINVELMLRQRNVHAISDGILSLLYINLQSTERLRNADRIAQLYPSRRSESYGRHISLNRHVSLRLKPLEIRYSHNPGSAQRKHPHREPSRNSHIRLFSKNRPQAPKRLQPMFCVKPRGCPCALLGPYAHRHTTSIPYGLS